MNQQDIVDLSFGELVIALPGAAELLQQYQIDWFKYHTHSIDDFLKVDEPVKQNLLNELSHLEENREEGPDWLNENSVTIMVDYVFEKYHKPERIDILRIWRNIKGILSELDGDQVSLKSKAQSIQNSFRFFREEFLYHLDMEEKDLFPMLRKMDIYHHDKSEVPPITFGTISKPLHYWEDEHKLICEKVSELQALVNDQFLSPDEMVLAKLINDIKILINGIRQHVNFEDVILERAAYKLEQTISL